jgi:hypothetical protein
MRYWIAAFITAGVTLVAVIRVLAALSTDSTGSAPADPSTRRMALWTRFRLRPERRRLIMSIDKPSIEPVSMTTKPVDVEKPVDEVMQRQTHTYSSPLSFIGSTKRLLTWFRNLTASGNIVISILVWGVLAPITLLLAWCLDLVWTILVVITVLPLIYRLGRRQQRKNKAVQDAQLLTLQRIAGSTPTMAVTINNNVGGEERKAS